MLSLASSTLSCFYRGSCQPEGISTSYFIFYILIPNWADWPLKYGTLVMEIEFLLSWGIFIPVSLASLVSKATNFYTSL